MIKKFLTKQALRFKGVPKEQAEQIANELSNNPELAVKLKSLESNKEVMGLFKKIQEEIELKKKSGVDPTLATFGVMSKYKKEITKYQDELGPLMSLFTNR